MGVCQPCFLSLDALPSSYASAVFTVQSGKDQKHGCHEWVPILATSFNPFQNFHEEFKSDRGHSSQICGPLIMEATFSVRIMLLAELPELPLCLLGCSCVVFAFDHINITLEVKTR
jgi:hypothetical protein